MENESDEEILELEEHQRNIEMERKLREILYPINNSVDLGIKKLIYGTMTVQWAKNVPPGLPKFNIFTDEGQWADYCLICKATLRTFFRQCSKSPGFPHCKIENVGRTVLILRELHRNVNFPVMVQYRLEVLKGEKVRECFR